MSGTRDRFGMASPLTQPTSSDDDESDDASALSAILIRLLDPSRTVDYLIAFAIGFAPIVCAFIVNAAYDMTAGCDEEGQVYEGYLQFPNWWTLALLIPGLLYVLRWAMVKISSVHAPWPPERIPPIINLLDNARAKPVAYASLRRNLLARSNLGAALGLVVVITVLDAWMIFSPYVTDKIAPQSDWTSMFQADGVQSCSDGMAISKTANFVLLVVAYNAQATITFLGVIAIVLVGRHNLFFLSNIYQRRRSSGNQIDRFFKIDVTDVNRCFGFRIANEAFNTQVKCLMIAGLAMLLSRYAHSGGSAVDLRSLFQWPPVFPDLSFPVAGQWLMAVTWLIALAIVAMPGAVKLLPLVPGRGVEKRHHSISLYLKEFFSDGSWPKNRSNVDEPVTMVAARFADNSFWPTGDNRARMLFFLSYWIFFVILLTPTTESISAFGVGIVVCAGLAYLFMMGTFLLLRLPVAYIDELLVKRGNGNLDSPSNLHEDYSVEKADIGVFISYRRADTAEYARSIHKELLGHLHEENVFRDISDIAAGENFVDAINRSLESVDAVIVLIGRDWLAATEASGQSRLHDPDDMVRMEIVTALRSGKRILPVLVDNAVMPQDSDLPDELRVLSQINALEISNTRWDYDVGLLVDAIRNITGTS